MNYSTLLTRSVDFEPYAEGQFGETIEDEICTQAGDIPDPTLAATVGRKFHIDGFEYYGRVPWLWKNMICMATKPVP